MAGLDHAHLPGGGAKSLRDLWFDQSIYHGHRFSGKLTILTVALMAALLAVDVLARPPISVGVLYGFAIFMAATQGRRSWVVTMTLISAALTILGYKLTDRMAPGSDALIKCIYGICLQAVILVVVLRSMRASRMLLDQAKLLDQTHDSVVLRRVDARLLYWNKGAEQLFGWSFEEARQKTQAELIGSGTTLPPMPIEEFIEHGPWQGEIVVFTKGGRRMHMDCRCSLLLNGRGKPYAILTTGNDVTERHEALERLQESEIRYRNIFQTTGIGIWECDFSPVKRRMDALEARGVTDLRAYLQDNPEAVRTAIEATVCIDVNEASIRMFAGQSKEDLLGPVGWVWPRESEPMFRESIIAAREGLTSFEAEAVLNTLDGRQVHFFLSTAFPPESTTRESVFVTVTDISARTAANAALRAAQADLAHATRLASLGELAASIAHEVNQPIGGILANGQAGLRWLQRQPPDLGAVSTSLADLIDEAKRARAVINGVRALARNELPHPERLELASLIDETLRLLAYELDRSGIAAVTHLDRSLLPVWGDRIQVQQVLINLVLNATQAMAGHRSGAHKITVSTSASDDAAIVLIEDTGPGVPTSVRERLFTAFTSTRSDGIGLGLSVCASIIRRHGGRIWLDQKQGQGARFAFSVPFHPADTPVAIS